MILLYNSVMFPLHVGPHSAALSCVIGAPVITSDAIQTAKEGSNAESKKMYTYQLDTYQI